MCVGGRELIRVFTFPAACNLQSVSWVLKNVVHNVPWFSRFYKLLKIVLMRDDVEISLVTSKRGLVVMVSREY